MKKITARVIYRRVVKGLRVPKGRKSTTSAAPASLPAWLFDDGNTMFYDNGEAILYG